MIVIDMDMPKSCEECKAICSRFNGNEIVYYCGLTDLFIANYSEDLCEPRDINCPIKCDIEDIKQEIEEGLKACVSIEDNTEKGIYPRIYSKDEMSGRKITYEHCLKIIDKNTK